MKTKRTASILLSVLLLLSVILGCSPDKGNQQGNGSVTSTGSEKEGTGGTNEGEADLSEEVELKMILLGDTPVDAQVVYDELNQKLKEDINATVKVEFLSWADWAQKYPLILASGEDYDLISSARWSDYFKNAKNGAFYEITPENLNKYAPQTVANSPQEVLDSAMVDGKLYNLPMNYKEVTVDGYIVRGDLRKKYNINEIKSLDDFGAYLDVIKKNEPDMIPWDTGAQDFNYLLRAAVYVDNGYYNRLSKESGVQTVVKTEEGAQVQSSLDIPELKDYLVKMKEWRTNGYWSKNAMVNKIPARDSFVNGKSAAFIDNLLQASSTYTSLKQSQPDWELEFYPITTNSIVANPYINNGMAINAKSKNPERALMLLDLLRNDKWYNQLTTYGIEGKHWELSSDGRLVSLPESANFPPDSACPWGWRDSRFYLTPADTFPVYESVLKEAQDRAVPSNIALFSMDKTIGNMASIEAAIQDISDQYFVPLVLGYLEDIDAGIENLRSKVQSAGFEEYIQETQKQLEAFGVTYQ
ncbi:extracellular solute-binding protein [Paenibacillus sp. F411]|uniref:extracellular solute-binding protein n=1 Tax=Paenibacillus sp. F411 TaxID=2820239 RepID=UPI001AAEE698|nr:extracellular solute-binding protein [Paenibacillus sp. F411]MBO2943389.1 extracellular solute-binding protein [Paenibacillus sp. F411]